MILSQSLEALLGSCKSRGATLRVLTHLGFGRRQGFSPWDFGTFFYYSKILAMKKKGFFKLFTHNFLHFLGRKTDFLHELIYCEALKHT